MAGAPPASPAQPTDHPRRSLVCSSSRKRAVSVACPRSLWQLIASAEAVWLQHEQAQRLCRAISERPTSTACSTTTSGTGMFATPPLLMDDPAEQLHEIAGNPPTSGSSCSDTAAAASLATAAARQTPSAGTLDTAVAPSTTPTSSPDVLLAGDFVAVTGSPRTSSVKPQYVPLPIDANLEDMDTTLHLGSDDEGASRKLQAVRTAPHIASTTKLPPRVTGEDRTQSSGVVQGAHGNYADEYLLAAVSSKVLVIAAKRQGTTLVLRFAAPYPPTRIYLFIMPFEVLPSRLRPLQCLRCMCYGHATATCQRPVRRLQCGGPHQTESCCSSRVRCLHCGGPHPAESPDCQLWQRERRLATIKASAPTHLSHREAQAVLRATPTSSVAAASGPPRI
ncbi:hypothetical protein HPB49_002799 [Dermacentor silvarum]|uniref:Uncharacterized protein n=1 Tax=Dermacentor silvarum TaxID=543639 RepID=A0ACB8CPB6_DERSI|nr:hypothetical protein HPB49_002799 [Dermacentor silvarum]